MKPKVDSTMPHNYNREAFDSVRNAPNKLVALYASLVRIEIALKDYRHSTLHVWSSGHDVPTFLADLHALDAGVVALAAALSNKLSVLWCRKKDGSETQVSAQIYPAIRYLLHDSDFAGKSTEAELMEAIDCVRDIETALGRLALL